MATGVEAATRDSESCRDSRELVRNIAEMKPWETK